MIPWSCVHTVHEARVFCCRTLLHLLFQCIIINGISIFMQNSFFVAFVLELFSFPSMPRWPFGQCEYLNSREIQLCPFCCLNHSLSSTHTRSFLSWISFCCSIFSVHKSGRIEGQMPLQFEIYQKLFSLKWWQGKLHHPYICLGKRKQTGKYFCRMMDSGVSVCSKEGKNMCEELEEIKNVCGYRWLLFGIHNWGDS